MTLKTLQAKARQQYQELQNGLTHEEVTPLRFEFLDQIVASTIKEFGEIACEELKKKANCHLFKDTGKGCHLIDAEIIRSLTETV